MKNNLKTNSNEIDLIQLAILFWEGKWKILLAIFTSVALYYYINSTQQIRYTAITRIDVISSSEFSKYLPIIKNFSKYIYDKNSPKMTNSATQNLKLSKENFLLFYNEILNEKNLFQNALIKFKVLDANQYSSEKAYNQAVIDLASTIKIDLIVDQNKNNNSSISYSIVEFEHTNIEKWNEVMSYVNKFANKAVKEKVKSRYMQLLMIENQKKKYEIEDLSLQINNLFLDYERKMDERISYLKEQASIAKKLEMDKPSSTMPEVNILPNFSSTPFYYRGYEAINEEISLIIERKDKRRFIGGLLELEQKLRSKVQDKTLERLELVINESPLGENKEFKAISAKINETKYKNNVKNYNNLLLPLIIGTIIGLLYVVLSFAVRSKINTQEN